MKNTLTSFFAILFIGNAMAQAEHFDINLNHQWNYLDRDIELGAERFFNKNGIQISLRYFQNTAESYPNWQDKPRATTFGQHLGLSIAYLRYLPLQESNVELYPYFKLTGFNLPYQTQDEVSGLYSEPASWKFYSALGLQVKCKLYKNLYLTGTADAGARWEKIIYSRNEYFNGISATGSVGLAYRIK